MTITLTVHTPDKKLLECPVIRARLPGTQGNFEIRHNHAPIISTLNKGNITYTTPKGTNNMRIDAGILHADDNHIHVYIL